MTVENGGNNTVTTIEPGPLNFTGRDAFILCDLINNNMYMNALVNHRAGDKDVNFEGEKNGKNNDLAFPLADVNDPDGTFRAGYPTGPGPTVDDVIDFHVSGRAEEAAEAAFGIDPETAAQGEPNEILIFLEQVREDERKHKGLAYLVERFSGTIRNGTSRRILQSLGMFIEYTVKAENADHLAEGGDPNLVRANRLMW